MYRDQNRETKTTDSKKIILNLPEADCRHISLQAANYGLTAGELIENFIGELIRKNYSNGRKDREYAAQQVCEKRCWFINTKKYICFNDPTVYVIYYRATNTIYYNVMFAANTKLYVIK